MNHITMRITGLVQQRIVAFEQMGKSRNDVITEAPRTSISVRKLVNFFERSIVSKNGLKTDDKDVEKLDTEQGEVKDVIPLESDNVFANGSTVDEKDVDEELDAEQGDFNENRYAGQGGLDSKVPFKSNSVSKKENNVDDKDIDEELHVKQGDLNSASPSENDSSFETAPSKFTEGSASDQPSEDDHAEAVNRNEQEDLVGSANRESGNDIDEIEPNVTQPVQNQHEKNIVTFYADIPKSVLDDARNRKANRGRAGIKNKSSNINGSIRRMISRGISITKKKTGKDAVGKSKVNSECSVSKNSEGVSPKNPVSKLKVEDEVNAHHQTFKDDQTMRGNLGLRGKNVKVKHTREQPKRGSSIFSKLISCVVPRRQEN